MIFSYDRTLQAVRDMFSDTSVSPETTLENLQTLRDEIDMMIDGVESDISRTKRKGE